MGSFLDKPITEKEEHNVEGNGLRCGAAGMQGWRVTMEDAHTAIPRIEGLTDHGFFACYDGHGGDQVAKYSGLHVIDKLRATEEWARYVEMPDKKTMEAANLCGEAMKQAFFDIDAEMKLRPEVVSGEDQSGCTAIASIISPWFTIVANAGDSRSILCKGGNTIAMSEDHKPTNKTETERIENAGGCVSMRRVNGDLAVSRALGDFSYKQSDHLSAAEQQVSAEADIKIVPRDGTEEFLVICCDGIWDVMENDEVGDYLRTNLKNFETKDTAISQASCDLIDTCLEKGSRDNMSAIVVAYVENGSVQIATDPKEHVPILREEEDEEDGPDGQ